MSITSPSRWWLLTVPVAVYLGFAAWMGLPPSDAQARATYADSFGIVNALFSGLAFAGVIVTVLLQRDELKLQRAELQATRIELSRAADAQAASQASLERQAAIMNKAADAQIASLRSLDRQAEITARGSELQALGHLYAGLSTRASNYRREGGLSTPYDERAKNTDEAIALALERLYELINR